MPTLVKRKCDYCKKDYVGTGAKFCSNKCATLSKEAESLKKLKSVERMAKKLTNYFKLKGDYIVTSDWHLPLIDADIAFKMILIAKKFNIKKLAIVGDLIDFEIISRFDHKNRAAALTKDFQSAEKLLSILFEWFDRIDWSFGNHDERLSKLFNFQLEPSEFGRLITDQVGKKLFISSHPFMILENKGKWRLTHPKNFSIITARVPTKLADKYRCSVLGAHGHHLGFCFDSSGRDIAADLGCLTDYEKTYYVMYNDTTHPRWNKGFAMVRNGCYYQFSANPKATDWDFWLNNVDIPKEKEKAFKETKKKVVKKAVPKKAPKKKVAKKKIAKIQAGRKRIRK